MITAPPQPPPARSAAREPAAARRPVGGPSSAGNGPASTVPSSRDDVERCIPLRTLERTQTRRARRATRSSRPAAASASLGPVFAWRPRRRAGALRVEDGELIREAQHAKVAIELPDRVLNTIPPHDASGSSGCPAAGASYRRLGWPAIRPTAGRLGTPHRRCRVLDDVAKAKSPPPPGIDTTLSIAVRDRYDMEFASPPTPHAPAVYDTDAPSGLQPTISGDFGGEQPRTAPVRAHDHQLIRTRSPGSTRRMRSIRRPETSRAP